MMNDTFLELGSIKGESRDAIHIGEIDIVDWQWGMTQPGNVHTGGGGGAGKVQV